MLSHTHCMNSPVIPNINNCSQQEGCIEQNIFEEWAESAQAKFKIAETPN